jgi:hypothetical protein
MQKVSFQEPEEFFDMWECEKKIYGWREKCHGINSGIVNPWYWNFLMERWNFLMPKIEWIFHLS